MEMVLGIKENIPRLHGDKVVLTLLRNDEEAQIKYLSWMSDETTCVNIEKNMSVLDSTYMPGWVADNSVMRMGIVYRADNNLIGYCHIDNRSKQNACWLSINVGDSRYRGKGVGSDVMDILLRYCFDELNADSVHLDVIETNIPAIHLYQSKGFQISGRYRSHGYSKGRRCDWLHMDILHEEYSKRC